MVADAEQPPAAERDSESPDVALDLKPEPHARWQRKTPQLVARLSRPQRTTNSASLAREEKPPELHDPGADRASF